MENGSIVASTWLKPAEAALLWNVHPRTVLRWVDQGFIVGIKKGPPFPTMIRIDDGPGIEVIDGQVQGQEGQGRERLDGEAR